MKTSKGTAIILIILLAAVTVTLCISCALVHKYPDLNVMIWILSVCWIIFAYLTGEHMITVSKRAKYFEGILDDIVDWQ